MSPRNSNDDDAETVFEAESAWQSGDLNPALLIADTSDLPVALPAAEYNRLKAIEACARHLLTAVRIKKKARQELERLLGK